MKNLKKTPNKKTCQAGFTLLETLIAMTIMLIAFTAILSVQSTAIVATERSKQLNVVAMLAKNQMIKLEYSFEGKSFDDFKKEDGGTFEAPYEKYRWTSEVKEIKFPTFNLAGTQSAGGAGDTGSGEDSSGELGNFLAKIITKYLSSAIREVTLTLYWQRGSGEQSFSVSTYWVNLNNEFVLSD